MQPSSGYKSTNGLQISELFPRSSGKKNYAFAGKVDWDSPRLEFLSPAKTQWVLTKTTAQTLSSTIHFVLREVTYSLVVSRDFRGDLVHREK